MGIEQPQKTLSSRLLYAMRQLNISQSELARRVGIKQQVIQYLCTSNASKSKFSHDIASALGINLSWLISGEGVMQESTLESDMTIDKQTKIPLLPWDKVFNWSLDKSKCINDVKKWVNTSISLGENSYALCVHDTSMSPRFEIGATLIVDPCILPHHKDFVIMLIEGLEIPICRQLIHDSDQELLVPINSILSKEIKIQPKDRCLGIVRQIYYEYVRE